MSEDNKVFTYPEFTGRRRIYTDVEKITKENIFQVLEEAMLVHMENANNMVTLMRYEKGVQPLVRKKTIRKDVDIRVQDNLANQITEFNMTKAEKRYLALGMSADMAKDTARAELDNDMEKVTENMAKFKDASIKEAETEWLKSRPPVNAGQGEDEETDLFLKGFNG